MAYNGKVSDSKQRLLKKRIVKGKDEKLNSVNEITQPMVTEHVAKKIYEVVEEAYSNNKMNVVVGLKAVLKSLAKQEKGIVVVAGDVTPIEKLRNLPGLCEDRNIPYCVVSSKMDLGAALGFDNRACMSLMISENCDFYNKLREKIKSSPTSFVV